MIFRFSKIGKIKNMSKWTMPIAFSIKILIGLFFSYIYIYSIKETAEPSDAMRFLEESRMLHAVFFKSKSDFFALFTGIGDNARMIHQHLNKTFIWDAGNFTLINDSRNTIRANCLFHFISFGSDFVHTILLCALSLLGIQQLYISIQPYSKLKPVTLFYSLLLFPSLLFWSSSVLKEPFLILGIGLFSRACLSDLKLPKKIVIGLLGFLILILFKTYIILCLFPGILFYLIYKHLFKQRLTPSIYTVVLMILLSILILPKQRQKLTDNLSIKQFNLENVGKGGIHVYGVNGFYYFKPCQYKNIKIKGNYLELIHPSDVMFLPYIAKKNEIPKKIHLKITREKWLIHIIMPGTKSYIKTTNINFSFKQLLFNMPEAITNSLLRPFPTDNGNFLKYPAMLEAWSIILFLISAIYFRRNTTPKMKGIVSCLFIFSISLMLLIGWTTPVVGAIVRFRFPAQLALLIIGFILIDPSKISFKKTKHE